MRDYAEREFKLAVRQDDGATLREHLESGWRQTGIKSPELDVGEPPHCVMYLWFWFLELHRVRTSNGFGPNAIDYVAIDAWQRVTARKLDAWEVDTVFMLDQIYIASIPAPKKAEGS